MQVAKSFFNILMKANELANRWPINKLGCAVELLHQTGVSEITGQVQIQFRRRQ